MSKGFQPTAHPVLGLPTAAQAMALGEGKWIETLSKREEIIRQEKNDPFRFLWEPPIWGICDALMGFPWVDAEWAERVRKHLGFGRTLRILLILGGQRGGKTQYAVSRGMRLLRWRAGARAWFFHSTLEMSREYHQSEMYRYLPAELRGKDIKSRDAYIAYKQKTGFSEEKFVLPPVHGVCSSCTFKAYEQPLESLEGANLDFVECDELVPVEHVETLPLRVAERGGWVLVTFTPKSGYSETVKSFLDGSEVVKESIAYMCPKDGGPADVARALGHDGEEAIAEMAAAAKEQRACQVPQSVPERCQNWIEGQPSQPALPEGRDFKRVPRVVRCVDPEGRKGCVYFHSADNPYGNPREVWGQILAAKAEEWFIEERWYGLARKQMAARFPKFNPRVHGIDPAEIPQEGTNYLYVDPTSGRNFFMLWFRVTPNRAYVYREWPGDYYIPGIGVPGPWALPDGKKADGKPGPAQETFGWGYREYKKEIARLEGWNDFVKCEGQAKPEEIDGWDPLNGAREEIAERYVDSRFASAPKLERDRPTTLITDFEELQLFFLPTPGGPIAEGVQKINDLLGYDTNRSVDFFNQPYLQVSRGCPNLIFSLQTWTGKDGEKGACKDPVDCLHYFATSDCGYLGGETAAEAKESDFEERPKQYY